MAQRWCRAVLGLAAAVVVARASMTLTWNTHRPAPAASAATQAPAIRTGVVAGVHGTRVILRLSDGSKRVFVASPSQARMLQRLVGTAIQFQTP